MSKFDNPTQQYGVPIYLDRIVRRIPDLTDLCETDWHPATPTTRKLWRCYLATARLSSVLERIDSKCSTAEWREFLVEFSIPMMDLFTCLHDLKGALEGDVEARSRLDESEMDDFRALRTWFEESVREKYPQLKAIRDKLGAHTDRSLHPGEAAKLIEHVARDSVAFCLHASLFMLDRLSRFDCYSWSARGDTPEQFRLMYSEPFVIILSRDNSPQIVGFEKAASPRHHIHERIARIVEQSTWIFGESKPLLVVNRRDDCRQAQSLCEQEGLLEDNAAHPGNLAAAENRKFSAE